MPVTPNAIMLFAAGFGTRMGDLTAACPKPLIKVANIALIDHALKIVTDADLKTVVVNTHYMTEKLVAHLEGHSASVSHEPDILETGGGLRHALPLLGPAPVYTLNTDAIWTGENPLTTLANAWNPKNMDALLLLVPPDRAGGYTRAGDFMQAENNTLKRGPGLVYTGAQIIKTEGLKDIPDTKFSMHELWDQMYDTSRIFGVIHRGGWCDVGTPAGIKIAEDMLGEQDV